MEVKEIIENKTFNEERALYNLKNVEANIIGNVISIKNPKSGIIIVDSVGEIIKEDPVIECNGEIIIRRN